MITILLSLYFAGFVFTSIFAAYVTGIEQQYMIALQPQAYTVNWTNNFFQSVLWFGYWACVIAKKRFGIPTQEAAKKYFGFTKDTMLKVHDGR